MNVPTDGSAKTEGFNEGPQAARRFASLVKGILTTPKADLVKSAPKTKPNKPKSKKHK